MDWWFSKYDWFLPLSIRNPVKVQQKSNGHRILASPTIYCLCVAWADFHWTLPGLAVESSHIQWTLTDFQWAVCWVHWKWQGPTKVWWSLLDKQWECKVLVSLLELGPLTPLQTKKIYPYHLSFTKYILRPCQPISKVWQWHLRGHSPTKFFSSVTQTLLYFVWCFRVHVSKIYFGFQGFLWANIYRPQLLVM